MDPSRARGEKRARAIESVASLYQGFVERFGDTDCYGLTRCDRRNPEDIERFMREESYRDTCFNFFAYVLAACLDQAASVGRSN